jgi:hypothetical protein
MLASAAALIGGGQALAPTPAVAMVDSGGEPCSNVSWFDQFDCTPQNDDGGGSSGSEVIFVSGVAPKPKCSDDGVICIPLGPGKPGPPDPDSRPPREGSGRGHQPQPDGTDRGHAVCKKPSTGREGVVCPGTSAGKKNPPKPRDLLAEELQRARLCRLTEANLRRFRKWREEVKTGQLMGKPLSRDSPDRRRRLLDIFDEEVELENQSAVEHQCHLHGQT